VPSSTAQVQAPNATVANPGIVNKPPNNSTVANAGVIEKPPVTKVPPIAPNQPTRPASLALREGMLAFFSGEYRVAMQRLDVAARETGASPRARAFLAFAKAGLVLTGGADEALLREARADYRSAQRLADNDRRFVSPKVLALLERTP
jgi:hypothetical protein